MSERYGVPGMPPADLTDPADLEAWFSPGSFSIGEHYRKCVQAQCEELIRAQYALKGEKISEGRIETLARLHENYLEYLHDMLQGRKAREQNVRDSLYSGRTV